MTNDPTVHLRLDVTRCEGTLMGEVGIDGGEPQRFTGWIALNAAIGTLLDGLPQGDAVDVAPPGSEGPA